LLHLSIYLVTDTPPQAQRHVSVVHGRLRAESGGTDVYNRTSDFELAVNLLEPGGRQNRHAFRAPPAL